MTGFRERLTAAPAILLDGGLGTELIAAGLTRGTAPESWNLERPDVVATIHRAYVTAGSEAVHTNTFGANPIRLAAFGLEPRCEEINHQGVRLALDSGAQWVIGDMGPTGEYLPPVGHGDTSRWRAAFARQAEAFRGTGIHAVHIETMSDVREALAALEAVLEALPGLPVMVSMTFERKKRGFATVMGDRVRESLQALASRGAAAVGANCSIASADMRDLVAEAAGVGAPLVAQPNAGKPENVAGSFRYAQRPDEFAADMSAIAGSLAAVGGCCGTDPRFIRALAGSITRLAATAPAEGTRA